MKITVKLFASFRDNRFRTAERDYTADATPRAVMEELGLTEEEMGIVLINGRHVSLDDALRDGDSLALFPLVGGG